MEMIIISMVAGIILGFFMGTISAECKATKQSNLIELNKEYLIETLELLNEQRKIYFNGEVIILESEDVIETNRILPKIPVEDRVNLPI